jgi:hypothetical protein
VGWIQTQRGHLKKGQLTELRFLKLRDIGLFSTEEAQSYKRRPESKYEVRMRTNWEKRFNDLVAYKREYDSCQVSQTIDKSLQSWVCTQRNQFLDGNMPADRIAKFKDIRALTEEHFAQEPGKSNKNTFETRWNERYNELVEFRREHGLCAVSKKNHPKLRAWVFQQIGNYRAGKLSDKKIKKLEELGVSWNIKEKKWKTRLEQLIQFKHEHGHCNVTKNYETHPKLWLWCENRRRSFKMGKLKAERKAKLDKIGFDWEFSGTETISNNDTRQIKLESRWNERYNELVEFRRKYGLCAIPTENPF